MPTGSNSNRKSRIPFLFIDTFIFDQNDARKPLYASSHCILLSEGICRNTGFNDIDTIVNVWYNKLKFIDMHNWAEIGNFYLGG